MGVCKNFEMIGKSKAINEIKNLKFRKLHVLRQIQNNEDNQRVSLRFSFSIYNNKEEVDYVISQIVSLIN